MKKFIAFILTVSLLTVPALALSDGDIEISAPSAVLMEKETGEVIYEKNPYDLYEPASVTKVMTLLLIVEAIEAGILTTQEMVTTSTRASSMGGSQIYLKEGEQMTLHDMLKAVVVVSANDASVALAEHLSGTEQAFVVLMNERAAQLGMEHTTFKNCTGLDAEGHLTCAYDIALMSRELIKHSMIKEYTTIWMDSVRNGEFGLANTNRLIRFYDGATGLKTGSTSTALYCLAATAERDGTEYIAAIMHARTSDERFNSATTLLNYAFANYSLAEMFPDEVLLPIPVTLGKTPEVQPILEGNTKLLIEKRRISSLTKTIVIEDELTAPVEAGQKVGELTVKDGQTELIRIPIVAGDKVEKLNWYNVFVRFLELLFIGSY